MKQVIKLFDVNSDIFCMNISHILKEKRKKKELISLMKEYLIKYSSY